MINKATLTINNKAMENHEKFSKKLSRLKEYNAITQPAKYGYQS